MKTKRTPAKSQGLVIRLTYAQIDILVKILAAMRFVKAEGGEELEEVFKKHVKSARTWRKL